MRLTLQPRRGVAMITAVLAIVVITIIMLGGFFASSQEFRSGRNLLVEQRAFAVAEYGLNSEVANWDRSRNLPSGTGKFPIGMVDATRRYVADGDTAFVRISRLTETTFWVTSQGKANMGFKGMESQRTTNAFVRIAYPSIKPQGAITVAGSIDLSGASKVSGESRDPAGWGAMCDDFEAETVAALRVSPTATVNYKSGNILSNPPTLVDPAAADSNTYIRYGSETWESLVANADVKLPPGTYNTDILPKGTDTQCDRSGTSALFNWGEPWRQPAVATAVKGCYGFFPIIYVDGDLVMNSKGRGQGILLVNGSLKFTGQFEFYGIVIVKNDIEKGNGTATIYGAVYSRNWDEKDGSSWVGTQDVFYSRCALENALRGTAVLTRVNDRHWSQLY